MTASPETDPPETDPPARVRALLDDALLAYRSDPAATVALRTARRRLDEPLRLAIAGMVKAGKSTLLNALLGEELAPTGAAECTQVVIWYRFGLTPRVTLHRRHGEPVGLAVHRSEGRLDVGLAGVPADEVDRIEVEWPLASLRTVTLIDTPGIASASADISARSMQFLAPGKAPSAADAVLYLLRHLHASDVQFLAAFRDTAAGRSGLVNTVAVLSRADEVGAGRIDALLSARSIAERYRRDEQLRRLTLDVLPVAGLLAQSARTLRQDEHRAFAELGRLDRAARERLLLSADRFSRDDPALPLPVAVRRSLLARYGMFGIRLAAVLYRGGLPDAPALSAELVRRSGLDELRRTLATRFTARAEQLKARSALGVVAALLEERPPPEAESLRAAVERIMAADHELREVTALGALRTEEHNLPGAVQTEAERLLGGDGVEPGVRLGLPEDADAEQVRTGAAEALRRWRTRAEHPLTDRRTADLCRLVVRSCEAMLTERTWRTGAGRGADAEPGEDEDSVRASPPLVLSGTRSAR